MKNSYKILVSIIVAALLIAGAAALFWAFRQGEKASEQRKKVQLVLASAESLLSDLKDAETGQRGFLLTGDETFLEPYIKVRDGILGHLEELRRITLVSAAHDHLDRMVPLVTAKLAELKGMIDLRRKHELTTVISIVRTGQGKRLMDSIRDEQRAFIAIEQENWARHDAEFERQMRRLLITLMAGTLFVLLLAVAVITMIRRETLSQVQDQVHARTLQLLEIQENTNIRLNQTNAALQISEEKLTVTLQSIGDGVMATDAEGKVTLLNALAEQLTGWTQSEAMGKAADEVFQLVNEKTRQPRSSPIKATLTLKTTQKLEDPSLLISRQGVERAIADSCAPIRHRDGEVVGAVLVFRDVTERIATAKGLEKAHQELKELATELTRVAKVKSEFLANMSHELRTPLNSIIGFSEVLCDETFGPLIEKQKDYVGNVLTSGKHLLLLINQILDMSKVEAGKMELAVGNVFLKGLLTETSKLMEHLVSKKKLQMSVEIADELPIIKGDDLKLKEVLYNLLSNAINFTPAGGKIGIRAMKVASDVEIVVWDTGVGIAPENMEKIFEGFFRVNTPYSRLVEGTGLGLPISRKLVELHGGKLIVESAGLKQGTLVRVTLPIHFKGA